MVILGWILVKPKRKPLFNQHLYTSTGREQWSCRNKFETEGNKAAWHCSFRAAAIDFRTGLYIGTEHLFAGTFKLRQKAARGKSPWRNFRWMCEEAVVELDLDKLQLSGRSGSNWDWKWAGIQSRTKGSGKCCNLRAQIQLWRRNRSIAPCLLLRRTNVGCFLYTRWEWISTLCSSLQAIRLSNEYSGREPKGCLSHFKNQVTRRNAVSWRDPVLNGQQRDNDWIPVVGKGKKEIIVSQIQAIRDQEQSVSGGEENLG